MAFGEDTLGLDDLVAEAGRVNGVVLNVRIALRGNVAGEALSGEVSVTGCRTVGGSLKGSASCCAASFNRNCFTRWSAFLPLGKAYLGLPNSNRPAAASCSSVLA